MRAQNGCMMIYIFDNIPLNDNGIQSCYEDYLSFPAFYPIRGSVWPDERWRDGMHGWTAEYKWTDNLTGEYEWTDNQFDESKWLDNLMDEYEWTDNQLDEVNG